MGESEIVQRETIEQTAGQASQQLEDEEKKRKQRVIHFLIQVAGWSVDLARQQSRSSSVISQLSQAAVDLRQANEALRESNPDIPLHLVTDVDLQEQIEESLENFKTVFEEVQESTGQQSESS